MLVVLDLIQVINGIGIEWTYVLLDGLSILPLLPLICGAIIIGLRCRIKRQYARDTNLMITNTITYIVAYLPYLDDLGSDRQTSMKF